MPPLTRADHSAPALLIPHTRRGSAFLIAVIQNGMNLTGVEGYAQKVVLGAVILAAVFLDMLRKHGWRLLRRGS